MTTWEEVRTAALVGTDRREPPAEVVAPDGTVIVTGGPPAERVLLAAAVLAPWRAAGTSAMVDEALTGEAGPDERDEAPDGAHQVLDVLLGGATTFAGRDELVAEWIVACDGAGYRVRHRALLPVLNLGVTDVGIRPAALGCLDQRGRWLAGVYDGWDWVVDDEPDEAVDWETASRDERRAHLHRLRSTDPAAGRALLAAHLTGMPAKERVQLVSALATGLGDDDAEVLETLLDDRSKDVRLAAARLLDALPASARARRLGAVLTDLLAVSGRGRTIDVDLPGDNQTVALERDLPDGGVGVVGDAVRRRIELAHEPAIVKGKRAQRLVGTIAGAPLSTWTDAGARPDAVVALALERNDILYGLVHAVIVRRDRGWAEALFAAAPLAAIVPVLDPAHVDAALNRRLPRSSETEIAALLEAADALDGVWSATLSRTVVRRLRKAPVMQSTIQEHRLARHLHPDVTPEIEAWIRDLDGTDVTYAQRAARRLLQSVIIRRTIAEEFA